MFAKNLVSQSLIDAVKDVINEKQQVDEISKELAHSYLKKRYAQTGATRQDKPKGMSRTKHDKQLMGLHRAQRRLTTTLELPKGTDPSQGGKYTADSVELDGNVISELSNEKLIDYLNKAHADAIKHPDDPTKRPPEKANKTVAGYAKAFNRKYNKEEVEQIDELSKDTLGSYLDKKKSEFMKGKTQPGTKEYNKDVQSMGKAHDKMKKEEVVDEGWDDMLKSVKDKQGPQPSGGSGVKQGSRYGGSKQKDKPEQDTDESGKKVKEELSFKDRLLEREMTSAETRKKERIVMSMKDKTDYFKKKYGKRWKDVMYATATKQAMKEETQLDETDMSTDMLRGRLEGGQDQHGIKSDFKKFKVKLAGDGIKRPGQSDITQPNMDNKGETPERQKITTNPGPVEVKLDDKYSTPNYPHSKAKEVKENVMGVLKTIRSKENKEKNKDSNKFHKEILPTQKEEFDLDEANKSHTHAAHYENDKGEWTGMNLLVAKDDDDAIKQAHEKCKDGCRLSRVERHIPVKEEEESGLRMAAHASAKQGKKSFMFKGKMYPVTIKKEEAEQIDEIGNPEKMYKSVAKTSSAKLSAMKAMDKTAAYEKKRLANTPLSRAKAAGMSKEEYDLGEAKDPAMDAGVGSQTDQAQNANTSSNPVMNRTKDLVKKTMHRVKSEMLMGKAPGNN